MAWLFERTVETAAWVALVVAWSSLALAVVWMFQFIGTLGTDPSTVVEGAARATGGPDYSLLRDATKAAGAFVGFSLALGGLACVDRFLFDADDQPSD